MKVLLGLFLLMTALTITPFNHARASSTVSVLIDGTKIQSMDELHETIATALNLPSYYGKNLDALFDVLTDEDLIPQKIDIAIFSGSVLGQNIGEENLAKLLDLINDAQENNATHIDFIYWQ